jgi:hypothetical protein
VNVGFGAGHKKVARTTRAARRRRVEVISEVVEVFQVVLPGERVSSLYNRTHLQTYTRLKNKKSFLLQNERGASLNDDTLVEKYKFGRNGSDSGANVTVNVAASAWYASIHR